jgi:anti-sigma regulatory factor (Ser/Thr protein kinase)
MTRLTRPTDPGELNGRTGALRRQPTADDAAADGPAPRAVPAGGRERDRKQAPVAQLAFERNSLPQVRWLTARTGAGARLSRERCEELVLAVDELATNSVVHGGGHGELRLWPTAEGILCEVRDHGTIADPLVGRRPPRPEQIGGRGLWVVGRLCDRMDVCSSPGRTVVRVHVRR